MSQRQFFGHQSFIVQQARESFTGGLEVVKETCQCRLATRSDAQEREHEITDGFLLMPMCVGQNKADILAEASGQRALVHRRNNALTRDHLVTTRLLFQMCPDIRWQTRI